MMDEPRFAQPIPNVTVAVGRDANLPCVVEHLGAYKVNIARHCMHIMHSVLGVQTVLTHEYNKNIA